MCSGRESNSYLLDERQLKKENFLNLHLRTNEEVMRRLDVAATGYVQVIVVGWVVGKFSLFIQLFYYLLLCMNNFWDSFELYLLFTGHELLELMRAMP